MKEARISATESAYGISARAFLNSLMKEWSGWSFAPAESRSPFPDGGTVVRFPLPAAGCAVLAGLSHASGVGYRGFRLPLFEERGDAPPRPIAFPHFVSLLVEEPTITGAGTAGLTFLRRVLDSVANIDDFLRSARQRRMLCAECDPGFIEAEQALRFGHAVHPAPRSRDEFSIEDSHRFAPEYGNGFALRWWSAAPECVAHGSSRDNAAPAMTRRLAESDPALAEMVAAVPDDGRIMLPMHPWQAARLMLEPEIEALFRCGALRDLGQAGSDWFATSSLRSIHAAHAPWMLKFSLSLRLTNSRRIVETRECERGLEIDKLLAGELGQTMRGRFPFFRVMGEPAHLSLRLADGRVLPETTVVFRDNPFRNQDQSSAAVLAALCEIHADGRGSALADLVLRIAQGEGAAADDAGLRWFGRFLNHAVAPLLIAQCDYGLLFGAHQQNLVIGLRDGWPDVVHFRDCQGTGYISEFLGPLAATAPDVRLEAGHIFASSEAARLMGYYLFSNSVFAVIGALAIGGIAEERDLVTLLRGFLEELARLPLRDKTCLDYLLNAPTLSSKGNFMICFRNINENTEVVDPLAGYVEQPNPIAEAAR